MTALPLDTIRTYRCIGKLALTSANTPPPAAAQVLYTLFMQLDPKEREILGLVNRFGQLSTKQIKALVYPGKRHDPQRRAIDFLLEHKLISRVNEPMRGGPQGGAQMYVYQLGAQGRKLYDTGRGASVVIKYHLLAIADVHIAILQAQRDKQLKVETYATEPDSHLIIQGLKPDLYEELVIRQADDSGIRRKFFIEVDLGTERQKQVMEQVTAYKAAYEDWTRETAERFPRVVFLAINDERKREMQYWMRRVKDLPDVFEVVRLDEVLTILQR